VFDLDGDALPTETAELVSDTDFGVNSTCGCSGETEVVCRCGAGSDDCGPMADPCVNVASRVQAATQIDENGECRLYIAYDEGYQANGEEYTRAVLRGFDITGELELDPDVLVSQVSASAFDVHSDFEAVVVADFFSPAVGLFYYRQEDADPCRTTFRGSISLDGQLFEEQILSPEFPTMFFELTGGLGDYVAGSTFTRSGRLFVSWSQPTPLQAALPCFGCAGQEYSLAVMGAEIIPE
jgi:hypothetical protein